MTKLGIQMQGMDNEIALLAAGPFGKKINPPAEDPFPSTRTIIRVYMDDNASNDLIRQGAAGGRAWAEFVAPYMLPWVYAVETWNEPSGEFLFPVAGRKQLTAATLAYLEVAHEHGWRSVVGNFSVGQPPLDAWHTFLPFIQAMQPGDLLGVHEYGWPTMQKDAESRDGILEGWLCLRYRKAIRILAGLGYRPQIFIGECGLDRLLVNPIPGGWQEMPHPGNLEERRQEYWNQLCWYDDRLAEDEQVVGAVPFTAAPSSPWDTYIIDHQLATWMRDRP